MSKVKRRIFISYQHEDQKKAKGFNLLQYNKNVDIDFVSRHLLDPVQSKNEEYIKNKIREQIKGSSVTVVLIGNDTKNSEYQPFEIEESLAKTNPNGILGIKMDSSVDFPKDCETAKLLHDCGAEIMDWDPHKFADAIERAATATARVAQIRVTPSGGSRCIR